MDLKFNNRGFSLIHFTVFLFLILLFFLLIADESFLKERDIKIKMPDGVCLATDLLRPSAGGQYPVVLIRTPYNKENMAEAIGEYLATNGFAVIVQDVRGKFASEGEFLPFVNERKDGLATLNWIARQKWCNGRIGMWGTSYLGYCSLVLGVSRHPSLKTLIQISGLGDLRPIIYPGGAFHLMSGLPQAIFMLGKEPTSLKKLDFKRLFGFLPLDKALASVDIDDTVWKMLSDKKVILQHKSEFFLADQYKNLDIPIFHISGWNDMVYRSTLEVYEAAKKSAPDNRQNPRFQKLLIGPWHHDQQWSNQTKVGNEDFGPQSVMGLDKIKELSLRWFDHFLKDADNGITAESSVRFFVMGRNEWQEADSWPLPGIEHQKWFLRSRKGAGSLHGDGRLSRQATASRKISDTYVFDPLNPVPTRGGVNIHFFPQNLGITDQRSIEEREDVLVYSSDPLIQDLEIVGPLRVVLYASSEGIDTDFTAKLVEVRSDGYARIIEDGIIRRQSYQLLNNNSALIAGKVYRWGIDLGATAILIKKGNRIRLEISSSNFPKYDRNPNTGENPLTVTDFKKVRQTVFHSPQQPSHLVLPVRISWSDERKLP